nr:immunoglobulin heavy chain junction region [Macaca mulatta]
CARSLHSSGWYTVDYW